jgi:hypothetical protein
MLAGTELSRTLLDNLVDDSRIVTYGTRSIIMLFNVEKMTPIAMWFDMRYLFRLDLSVSTNWWLAVANGRC